MDDRRIYGSHPLAAGHSRRLHITFLSTARASVDAFLRDDVLTLAAALAFYTLLSFAPVMVLAVWLGAYAGAGFQDSLLNQIGALAGGQARDAAKAVIDSGKAHPSFGSVAGIAGILTLVVSATTAFAQLQSSLNVIFGITARPSNAIGSWLRRRVLSLGVLAAFGFVLIVSLLVSAGLGIALPRTGTVWDIANQISSALVFAFLFGALFRYLPDARIPWRHAFGGGFVTAVLFALGKWAIGFYLARGDVGGAYGAAGSLAVLLVWSYYSGAIFFYGAELTKAWLDQQHIAIQPTAHGERRQDA
jgi:membrane protein